METLRSRLASIVLDIMRTNPAADTQSKLAALAGLAQSTIGRILNCEQSLSLDTLEQLADGLGYSRPEFMLMTAQERALLQSWGSLSPAERERVLGYIEATAHAKRHEVSGLNSTRAFSNSERAEQLAAQARPAGSHLPLANDHQPISRPSRGRSRKRH